MSDKFSSTIQIYNKYAQTIGGFQEKKFGQEEIDLFLSYVPEKGALLDAGCGSGRDTAYFTKQGYQAVGIDLSEGLLAEARKLHPESTFKLMSLTELDFPDQQFDGIWAKASILHLDRAEIPKVFNDFNRLLKEGGVLFIQTKKGEGEGTQPLPFAPEETRFFTFFQLEELRQLVTDAGFHILDSYEFNGKARRAFSADQEWIVLLAQKATK
jgi:ubiquinone/menaquinone biosynthesis C-methylase UbiE